MKIQQILSGAGERSANLDGKITQTLFWFEDIYSKFRVNCIRHACKLHSHLFSGGSLSALFWV